MTAPPELPPPVARPTDAPTALDGIRVVDFSHFIAGPLATMLLADMGGSEVIKVEKPDGGDDFRRFRPHRGEIGAPFAWANRNKRSLVLDLTTASGRQVARDLVGRADVVIENFSAPVMAGFGLGYDDLAADHPHLVYCSVSAYGRTGPDADRLGFDPVVQAESGFMALNGPPDQEPMRTGPSVMDMSTALLAANAILGALLARTRLGRGQYVEVCLFDTSLLLVGFHAMSYLMSGVPHVRTGNASRDAAPVGVFQAADGPFYLACANDRTYHRLARQVLDRPDLADHPDYADGGPRVANREALAVLLGQLFAGRPRADWLDRMRAAGVPAGAVRAIDEAMTSPEVAARGVLSQLDHPAVGPLPNIGPPFRFSLTPTVDPVAAPTLGQHHHEILAGVLGYDPTGIDALAAGGAFGPAAWEPR